MGEPYIPQRVFFDRTGVIVQDPLTKARTIYQRSTTPPTNGAPAGRAAAQSLPRNYRPSAAAQSVAAPQPANRPQILYLDRNGSQIRNPVTGRVSQGSRADPRSSGASSANPQAPTSRRARRAAAAPPPSQAPTSRPLSTPKASGGRAATGGAGAAVGLTTAAGVLLAGGSATQAIGVGAGVAAGGIGGQIAGGAIGGAIGTAIAGPAGTVWGANIGAGVGSAIGGLLGGSIGGALADLLPGSASGVDGAAVVAPNVPATGPTGPPFTGGQMAGVRYNVRVRYFADRIEGADANSENTWNNRPGPIYGTYSKSTVDPFGRPAIEVGFRRAQNTSDPTPVEDGGQGYLLSEFSNAIATIISVVRSDGLPDTGGDPPGAPAIAPATPRPVPPPAPPAIAPTPPPRPAATPPAPAPVPPPAPQPRPSAPPPPPAPAPVVPEPAAPPDIPAGSGIGAAAPAPAPTSTAPAAAPIGYGAAQSYAPTNTAEFREAEFREAEFREAEFREAEFREAEFREAEFRRPSFGPQSAGATAAIGAGLVLGTGLALARGTNFAPKAAVGTALKPVTRIINATTNQVASPPPPPSGPTTRTNTGCRCNAAILSKLDQIQGAGVAAQGGSMAGILAKLNQMQQFAEKAWRSTQAQKVLDMLTFIGVMHNAAFLSREVAETMSYMVGNVLNIFGIEDENGSNLDVFGWLGDTIEGFFVKVFGQDLVDDVRESWKKASAILRSASMIIWTVRSIFDGTQELLEWVGENTGKIGNALKRWGVVGFTSYNWMAENIKAQDRARRRYGRIRDGLETAEDAASSFAMATGTVLEIQQEVSELSEQRQAFNDSVRDFVPGADPDNSELPTAADEGIANAQNGAEISPADMERGTPP